MSDILRFKDDIDTGEYYKRCVHKNLGAKGETEYFSKIDLSEHDTEIRLQTIDEFLKRVLSDKYDCEHCPPSEVYCYKCVARRVAEQMKGEQI